MPQCKARQAKFPEKKLFGDEYHYFYVERRCRGEALHDQPVCRKCTERTTDCKIQERLQFDHGLVDEPIPEWSHIYDGPWYIKMVDVYGEPSDEVVKWAEKYKSVAQLEGDEHKAGERELDMDPFKKKRERGGGEEAPVKKIRGKKAAEAAPVATAATEAAPAKPKKTRAKKANGGAGAAAAPTAAKPKKVKAVPQTPTMPSDTKPPANLVATHLEKQMEILQVDDVEIIRVAILEHDGQKYYCDEKKGKLYNTGRAGKIGEYIGRWNSRTGAIETDIPDSDVEP
jgi:hypothetical protein